MGLTALGTSTQHQARIIIHKVHYHVVLDVNSYRV